MVHQGRETPPAPLKHVVIYTDGACIGNPGPGGYGVVLISGSTRKELSGGYRRTTNNRMEIIAAINGLRSLKYKCKVTLYSDSQYLVQSMQLGWAKSWKAKGWMRNKKERAINPDLWEQLLQICEQHEVEFIWIKGHAGQPENERCDILSTQAAQQKDLQIDTSYEDVQSNQSVNLLPFDE